jgi:hypothetical protein
MFAKTSREGKNKSSISSSKFFPGSKGNMQEEQDFHRNPTTAQSIDQSINQSINLQGAIDSIHKCPSSNKSNRTYTQPKVSIPSPSQRTKKQQNLPVNTNHKALINALYPKYNTPEVQDVKLKVRTQ